VPFVIQLQDGATFVDVPEDMKPNVKLIIGEDGIICLDNEGGRVGSPATNRDKAWAITVRKE
jgi:hypothetical protein